MDWIHSLSTLAKTWLLDGPLAKHIAAYAAHLERGSYSWQTSRIHCEVLVSTPIEY